MGMRRFTRLTNAFSKKTENYINMLNLNLFSLQRRAMHVRT